MPEEKKGKRLTGNMISETEALPKAIVRRAVKEKLSQLSKNSEISVLRDSLLAFSESVRIFIHYLSSTANDICKEANRQFINAEDVFKAMEELGFPEFIDPLRAALEELRQKNAGKKEAASKANGMNKKEKRKQPPTPSRSRKKHVVRNDIDKDSV